MIKSMVCWRVVLATVVLRKECSFFDTVLHSAPSDTSTVSPLRTAAIRSGLHSRMQLIAASFSCFWALESVQSRMSLAA